MSNKFSSLIVHTKAEKILSLNLAAEVEDQISISKQRDVTHHALKPSCKTHDFMRDESMNYYYYNY